MIQVSVADFCPCDMNCGAIKSCSSWRFYAATIGLVVLACAARLSVHIYSKRRTARLRERQQTLLAEPAI
eukprot:COSAG05_NODE_1337_length_5147_cov_25.636485_2_plen_70_part_00